MYLSVEEDSNDMTLLLYPNPAKDHISINSNDHIISVEVYNINGKKDNSKTTSK